MAGVWGRCWLAMLASRLSFKAAAALPGCGVGVLACGYVRDSTRATGVGRVSHLNVDDLEGEKGAGLFGRAGRLNQVDEGTRRNRQGRISFFRTCGAQDGGWYRNSRVRGS